MDDYTYIGRILKIILRMQNDAQSAHTDTHKRKESQKEETGTILQMNFQERCCRRTRNICIILVYLCATPFINCV